MKVTQFVLPYHLHSFQMSQILVFMSDLCLADSTKCYMDGYSELCYENASWITKSSDKSEVEFMQGWSKTVADKFSLDQQSILDLYTAKDTHNSNERVRENWKYGASVGVSGTPMAFIDGVKLDEYPSSAAEWETLFKQLFPTTTGHQEVHNFLQWGYFRNEWITLILLIYQMEKLLILKYYENKFL